MIQAFSAYPDWKAPAEDSALVMWPAAAQIVNDTLDNQNRLSRWSSPVAELRRVQRAALRLSDDRPTIATGHQTELFHPGVWAKLVLIDAAARALDAHCLFAAVDSDAPKHLQLRWPGTTRPITDDSRLASASWSGLLASPSAQHVDLLKSALHQDSRHWSFTPTALEFLNDLREQAAQAPRLSAAITSSMYRLDWSLGLRHQSILTSHLWIHEPYLGFVYYLLARAESFADHYNQSLREYREAHGIDNPGRPMPDLHVADGAVEAPFWLDDLTSGVRHRATVRGGAHRWRLEIGSDSFAFSADVELSAGGASLAAFLGRHNVRLAPRALTLTMFLRLLVVDQFVHGIGGGRYEQVNDRVIQRFFGIDPPAFSVTTATLLFPDAVGRTRACIPCLAHEGHRLRHAIVPEKMDMVREIQALPRRSPQRQRIFTQMHDRLAQAVQVHPSVKAWQNRMSEALRQSSEEQGMFDRELFYAIQPGHRLQTLMAKYESEFGG